jgi:hypothetical protein
MTFKSRSGEMRGRPMRLWGPFENEDETCQLVVVIRRIGRSGWSRAMRYSTLMARHLAGLLLLRTRPGA